jgi:hypothetical protein
MPMERDSESPERSLEEPLPLFDPLLVLGRWLGGLLLLLLVLCLAAIPLVEYASLQSYRFAVRAALEGKQVVEHSTNAGRLVVDAALVILGFVVVPLFYYWHFLPWRRPNAIFLRSFRNDEISWPMRKVLCQALGPQFRLSGPRDPRRRRLPIDYLGLPFFILRYVSPRYMNLECGDDWRQRLWRSLGDARCAVIDVSDLTAAVHDEIALACHSIGLERVLFVVSSDKKDAAATASIRQLLPGDLASSAPINFAVWSPNHDPGSKAFRASVQRFVKGLPAGQASLNRAGLQLAEKMTGPVEPVAIEEGWRYWQRDFLVGSVVLALGFPLLRWLGLDWLRTVFTLVVSLLFIRYLAAFLVEWPFARGKLVALALPPALFCGVFLLLLLYIPQSQALFRPRIASIRLPNNESVIIENVTVPVQDLSERMAALRPVLAPEIDDDFAWTLVVEDEVQHRTFHAVVNELSVSFAARFIVLLGKEKIEFTRHLEAPLGGTLERQASGPVVLTFLVACNDRGLIDRVMVGDETLTSLAGLPALARKLGGGTPSQLEIALRCDPELKMKEVERIHAAMAGSVATVYPGEYGPEVLQPFEPETMPLESAPEIELTPLPILPSDQVLLDDLLPLTSPLAAPPAEEKSRPGRLP